VCYVLAGWSIDLFIVETAVCYVGQLIYDTAIPTFTRPRVFPTFKHYKILSPNNK